MQFVYLNSKLLVLHMATYIINLTEDQEKTVISFLEENNISFLKKMTTIKKNCLNMLSTVLKRGRRT